MASPPSHPQVYQAQAVQFAEHAAGAPPSTAQAVEAAAILPCAPPMPQALVAQPMAQLQVRVPSGVAPGQQLSFTTPDGQAMVATVQDGVAPGSAVTVHYQPLQRATPPVCAHAGAQPLNNALPNSQFQRGPTLPATTAEVTEQETDRYNSNVGWALYWSGWLCCCCAPFITAVLWLAVVVMYFVKPAFERARLHRQRAVALVTARTCGILTCLGVFATVCSMLAIMYSMAMNDMQHRRALPTHGPHGPPLPPAHGPAMPPHRGPPSPRAAALEFQPASPPPLFDRGFQPGPPPPTFGWGRKVFRDLLLGGSRRRPMRPQGPPGGPAPKPVPGLLEAASEAAAGEAPPAPHPVSDPLKAAVEEAAEAARAFIVA